MSHTGSPCIFVLRVNASQAAITNTFRPCLPRLSLFLVQGIRMFVIDLKQDVACCTWPYHLSHRLWRTYVLSSMPSWCSSESSMPQIQQIMVGLQWSHHDLLDLSSCISGLFGPHVFLLWSIAEWTQVSYTWQCILGEQCLVVRTGKSFLNFLQTTQHLAAMALSQWTSQPPTKHSTLEADSGLHIKLGAVDIHFSHSSAIDGPSLAISSAANLVWAGHQWLSDATAPLALWAPEPFAFHASLPCLELRDTLLLGVHD